MRTVQVAFFAIPRRGNYLHHNRYVLYSIIILQRPSSANTSTQYVQFTATETNEIVRIAQSERAYSKKTDSLVETTSVFFNPPKRMISIRTWHEECFSSIDSIYYLNRMAGRLQLGGLHVCDARHRGAVPAQIDATDGRHWRPGAVAGHSVRLVRNATSSSGLQLWYVYI